jgi:alkanesulfonate monooxygenase SsuD/methylene tetrahydromethanopterin reductase-like flavin-dependent oxidoreductase (luciferase family)
MADAIEPPDFGLWYDFRNPPQWHRPTSRLYRESLEQIVFAEEIGFDSSWFSEHHFSTDGHMASPLLFAAAVAERTKTLKLGTNLIVSPLQDPIRLAEDSATLSLLSGGRFTLGVGQGYAPKEFEGFGKNIKFKPSLLEEGVAVIRRCWSGSDEPFEGKRYKLGNAAVTPVPEETPKLLVGFMTEAAAERAARIGDGGLTMANAHQQFYIDAMEKLGKPLTDARLGAGQWAVVAEDPEKVWAEVGKYALHQMNDYISLGAFGPAETTPRFESADQILEAGPWVLWDQQTAIDTLVDLVRDCPIVRDVHLWPQLPGEPIESGSERLQFVADKVLPEVRSRLESGS